MSKDLKNLAGLGVKYEVNRKIAAPNGADEAKINAGQITTSAINKLHLIKLADDFPYQDDNIANHEKFQVKTVSDLCLLDVGAQQYDIDDFLFCKDLGLPINRLVTLRRFPYPCTDNLWDKATQGEPDIARMVTYMTQDTNKLDDLLSFTYKLRWKELTAEFEQGNMQGDQTGTSGFMKQIAKYFDPQLANNILMGENRKNLDPKYDQNKVYGPVDSITNTHIRDVGFDFSKDFDLVFEYELRSSNGRTPEYVMKDILANVLACTYNNGKFWPGARYWVGDRPSGFYGQYQYMNPENMDQFISGSMKHIQSVIKGFGEAGSSAIDKLKTVMNNAIAMAVGKILDKVGRPGILAMNSLLSGEPTGAWHLTIGNPTNPTLCIGNLICDGVDVSFPTDSLSYGDFPTKMRFKIKLKPGQAKDRAGIEMMFNMGKQRIYYAPSEVNVTANKNNVVKTSRSFFNFETKEIDNTLSMAYDFISDKVSSITKTVQDDDTAYNTETQSFVNDNDDTIDENNEL